MESMPGANEMKWQRKVDKPMPVAIRLLAPLLACVFGLPFSVQATVDDPKTIHLGILAEEGKDVCNTRWRKIAEHVQHSYPQYNVRVVCLGFDEVEDAVSDGRVDFTITNPAMYVTLEYRHGASRIATLENLGDTKASTLFGGVLLTKPERLDIQSLDDIRGKKLAAVDPASFGGWLIHRLLLKQAGIDPHSDVGSIVFLGSHRKVVFDVLNGKADVGAVRTGIVEQMEQEGILDHTRYRVLNRQENPPFPLARSTGLYPNWALAKMVHVSSQLAEQVMFNFINIEASSDAARAARIQGWTIPLDYYPVHHCLQELKAQ